MKVGLLYKLSSCLLLFIFLWLPSIVTAQIGDPGCDPNGYRCDENGQNCVLCPIDNGVYILLAFGILYGLKKYFDYRKPKEAHSL